MNDRNHVLESRKDVATGVRSEQVEMHPAWIAFVRYCQEMGYGEIERLKIQDGIPVLVEVSRQKIKFS